MRTKCRSCWRLCGAKLSPLRAHAMPGKKGHLSERPAERMCHIAWAGLVCGGCTVGHKWSPFCWPVGREHPMLEVERSAKVQKGLEATKIKSCGPSLPVACPACRMRGGKAASAAYCAAWLGAWALQARDARSARVSCCETGLTEHISINLKSISPSRSLVFASGNEDRSDPAGGSCRCQAPLRPEPGGP